MRVNERLLGAPILLPWNILEVWNTQEQLVADQVSAGSAQRLNDLTFHYAASPFMIFTNGQQPAVSRIRLSCYQRRATQWAAATRIAAQTKRVRASATVRRKFSLRAVWRFMTYVGAQLAPLPPPATIWSLIS
jgi:hypothetical protein